MKQLTLTAQTGFALYTAWVQGLDTVEAEGYLFGMFEDGIWTIFDDTVVMNDSSKVRFMGKPSVAWGSNS